MRVLIAINIVVIFKVRKSVKSGSPNEKCDEDSALNTKSSKKLYFMNKTCGGFTVP
jgi:hypothetical protein